MIFKFIQHFLCIFWKIYDIFLSSLSFYFIFYSLVIAILGKWTLRQLRQTDAIVPLQSGTNQFDSQRVCLQFYVKIFPFLSNFGSISLLFFRGGSPIMNPVLQ